MRGFAGTEELSDVVRAVLGPGVLIAGVDRLRGGSKKGVYRVRLADGAGARGAAGAAGARGAGGRSGGATDAGGGAGDGGGGAGEAGGGATDAGGGATDAGHGTTDAGVRSVIVYRWAAAENFWPAGRAEGEGPVTDDVRHPFAAADGLVPFTTACRTLEGAGVRVPRVLWSGEQPGTASGRGGPVDVAVVEDVEGGTLEEAFTADPARARTALADLARSLDLMWRVRGRAWGKVHLLEAGDTPYGDSCEQVVLERAREDLAEAAARDTRIAAVAERLEGRLDELRAEVRPRTEYRLTHGELGPDHVLIDAGGRAVLIDIEDLMYFDAEWEYVFLRLRFRERYAALARPEHQLDADRLALYTLAEHLSLVAGPLRLLDGDFPDRALMREIAEGNLREVLALLP